jgi:Na+/alanine symporter
MIDIIKLALLTIMVIITAITISNSSSEVIPKLVSVIYIIVSAPIIVKKIAHL